MGYHAYTALYVHSVWWWAPDLVVCGLLWSWHCLGPVWCWWKSVQSSLATMCSISGPSLSMTFGDLVPRSSTGAFAQAPWTTSVSTTWCPRGVESLGLGTGQ